MGNTRYSLFAEDSTHMAEWRCHAQFVQDWIELEVVATQLIVLALVPQYHTASTIDERMLP